MNIVNPNYVVDNDKNIFLIRKEEYSKLEETVREMLKPAEELGYTILEFGIKESRTAAGELHKTLKKSLVMRLQKGLSEVDLTMTIPKLVDDNYIVIGGRRKIPLFQLFDIPVVSRGKTIKLRTNMGTLMVETSKEFPFVRLSAFSKNIPLTMIIHAKYGVDEVKEMFNLDSLTEEDLKLDTLFGKLLYDIKDLNDGSEGYTKEDFVKEIGSKISKNYDHRVKGEDFMYSLDVIPKIDIMTAKLLKTGEIITELIDVIKNGGEDDTDVTNKRIRCFEYMILSKVAKVIFDLCVSSRSTRTNKFNTNSKQILSDCNVSDIIQFDFAINPIHELTNLSRLSILGPNGFNRDNVPKYLRDITPSMFGRVCPVDTPDRDNCGILQNLLPNSDFDENLQFTDVQLEKQPTSIPVSMVPFLENDDQTRLQMAASQMRQAIMLTQFDVPMIQSGCESLYTDYSQFIKRARKNGQVIYRDSYRLIVIYDDKDFDVIPIGIKKIYVENIDSTNVYVNIGDKFKKGDILVESEFCNKGVINIGKNFLTAVMVYHGYNFEDGIVISDRLENEFRSAHVMDLSFVLTPDKVLLSLEEGNYCPLPEPPIQRLRQTFGDPNNVDLKLINQKYIKVAKNDSYAIMKKMPGGPSDYYNIFEEEISLTPKKDVLIYDVNLYVNQYNKIIPEFREWVEKKIEYQQKGEKFFHDVLYQNLPKAIVTQYIKDNNLDKFSHVEKYKIKGELINGILVEINSLYFRPIKVGDKIGNRHGNKGVISKIVPHKMMPLSEDGRNVDICINPLGIISRMNIGQLFELHLSKSLEDLKNKMLKMLNEKESQIDIRNYLLEYMKIIDNTETKWYFNQFMKQVPKTITKEFINSIVLIQPPFESTSKEKIIQALAYTETPFTYKVFDPVLDSEILEKISIGYMYFFRMTHIAESKISARGIGSYAKRTLQPLSGRKHKGGQRLGEMETACLIGHGALVNLDEFLTTKSDAIDAKNSYIKKIIDSSFTKTETDSEIESVPESVKLLESYLTVLGVKMK